jgi:23S rRNA A2030 N6-methylase RlmJ
MAGGGLLIVNAPWKLDETLAALAAGLAEQLGDGQGACSVDWVTKEPAAT